MSLSYKKQREVIPGVMFVKVYNHKHQLKYVGHSVMMDPVGSRYKKDYYPVGGWFKYSKNGRKKLVTNPTHHHNGEYYRTSGEIINPTLEDIERGNLSYNINSLFFKYQSIQTMKILKEPPHVGGDGLFRQELQESQLIDHLYYNGIYVESNQVYPYFLKRYYGDSKYPAMILMNWFTSKVSKLPDFTGIDVPRMGMIK